MFYAKLNSENNVERYPYTLTDLKFDTPSTSFPTEIDEETATFFNLVLVKPTTPPKENHAVNLERTAILQGSEWVEKWVKTPATDKQIEERTAACANDTRKKRNQLLAECDWTQLPDSPASYATWATYRQELRDVTTQAGFPWEMVWPEAP
jgi:hypothetical protein